MELDILQSLDTLGLIPLLFYWNLKSERRHDAQAERMEAMRKENEDRHLKMVRGWEAQLAELVEKYDQREQSIRVRYDAVVDRYNRERDTLFQDLDRKLDDVIRFIQGSR